jgi:regulator of cell morphogenesis and NO signaling
MLDIKLETVTVAEIVADNYKTADVFKSHGIDFCCGGKKSVKKVCEQKGLNYEAISEELENLANETNLEHDYNSWKLSFLIDFIVNTHHTYVKNNIPLITQYAEKVAMVHGDHNPENIEIARLFREISEDLAGHMQKEELILFSNIKRMEQAAENNEDFVAPPFGKLANPINMMEMEHDTVGDLGKQIAELSNNYQPPVHACNTYRVLYAKLEEFENDLHKHIHLENNILFPKAIKMEERLSSVEA